MIKILYGNLNIYKRYTIIYDTCNDTVSKYLELPILTSLIKSLAHAHWFSQYLLDPFPDFLIQNAVNNGICCMSKKEKIPEH